MNSQNKACDGAPTLAVLRGGEEMAQCQHCGTCVRIDLVDHYFFGFQTCEQRTACVRPQAARRDHLRMHELLSKYEAAGHLVILEMSELVKLLLRERKERLRCGA